MHYAPPYGGGGILKQHARPSNAVHVLARKAQTYPRVKCDFLMIGNNCVPVVIISEKLQKSTEKYHKLTENSVIITVEGLGLGCGFLYSL